MPDPDPYGWMTWTRRVCRYGIGPWVPRYRGTLPDAKVAARVWREQRLASETIVLPAGVLPVGETIRE